MNKTLQTLFQNDMEDFGILDLLSLWSVYAQYQGLKSANKDRDFNTIILKVVSNEIEKLHQEDADIYKQNVEIIEQNKEIIKQNDELLELLRGEMNARRDKTKT